MHCVHVLDKVGSLRDLNTTLVRCLLLLSYLLQGPVSELAYKEHNG